MVAPEEMLLAQLSLTCTEAKYAFAQHIGMSQTRLQLLMLLSHGESSHAVLQQRLFLDGATLTRQVKQFEAEGVVSRRLDPQDNRYTLVSLTASGQQMAAGLITAYQTFQTRLLDDISTEEQAITLRVFERLRANIRRIQQEEEGDAR
jgi:DNA-binding MarR family transcriptional regulator